MKRFLLLIVSIALAVSLFLCTQERAEPVTDEREGVVLKNVEPFYYVGLKHTGPYEEHAEIIGRFETEAEKQNLLLSGPMLGIYYNLPVDTPPEKLEWMLAFEVEDPTIVREPLHAVKWEYRQVVSYLYSGTPDSVAKAYAKIQKVLDAKKWKKNGPVMERFLNPHAVNTPPESLQTEIWFPVQTGN